METFTGTISGTLFVSVMIFFAGFVDSAAGGGGIISVPAYLFIGMPPHLALGSNKLSASVGTTFAVMRYLRNGTLDIKIALFSAATSFLGAWAGSKLALLMSEQKLKLFLVIILPFVAVFLLMKREYGSTNSFDTLTKKRAVILALLIGLVMGGYDGLLGPGTGTFAIIAYCTLMKYDLKTASGNAKLLNLASNYASLWVFFLAGSVVYSVAIPAAICGIAGNYMGAGMAIRKGGAFIRPMMSVVIILLLGKLAYDLYLSL